MPQAWAAGAVFLLVQACLGLSVTAIEPQAAFTRRRLPASLGEPTITGLSVGGEVVNMLLRRHQDDFGVRVLARDGTVDVLIAK